MIFRSSIFGIILLSLVIHLNGQGYRAPEIRMPGNIVKDFIQMHVEYPASAIASHDEGVVLLSFTVTKDGKVTGLKVTKSVSDAVDSAAIHLFSLILWKPANYLGKSVEGNNEFKIKYNINRYVSLVKKRGYDKIPLPFKPTSSSLNIYTVKELDKAPEADIDSTYKSAQDFITQHLVLPDAAIKLNLTGEVKLRFVIEPNGLPSNIMVIEPLGGGCTEEAIRIVQTIKWIPGIRQNEAVRTCYNLSFIFDPADNLKNKHIPNQSNTGI